MEVYAGFMEHADIQAGKMLDELERLGERDNTLIFYVFGDHGASAEGMEGNNSELLAQNGIPFPGTKLVAGYFVGPRTPKADAQVRAHFLHVNDIGLAVYDLLAITRVGQRRGVGPAGRRQHALQLR